MHRTADAGHVDGDMHHIVSATDCADGVGLFLIIGTPESLFLKDAEWPAGLGRWRGKLMRVAVDPETHELSQTVSPAALIFIVALIAIRSASRAMAVQMAGPGPAGLMAATDILMAFALGFIAFQRVEIFIRARRMLAEARAKRL